MKIKKRSVALLLLSLITITLNTTKAQIAINDDGTNGDASAMLDIKSTSKGLLLPRVALTGTTDISTIAGTEATSLMVYNTSTVSDVTPGFYYWNGTKWLRFIATNDSNGKWTISGIDMYSAVSGKVGIGTSSPSGKFHVNTGSRNFIIDANEIKDNTGIVFLSQKTMTTGFLDYNGILFRNASITNITGQSNYFIGKNTATAGTVSGSSNIAIGDNASLQLRAGSQNICLGWGAGTDNQSGLANINIGVEAGNWNLGSDNINIGRGANYRSTNVSGNTIVGHMAFGERNTASGSYNTSIGWQSGYLTQGSYNVFLGYKAGYNETGSNKLYIDNSNTSSPLIGGDFSTDEVYLNGKVGIGISSPTSKLHVYKNNLADGTSNTLLTLNGVFTQEFLDTDDIIGINFKISSQANDYNYMSYALNGNGDAIIAKDGGSVGIGTTDPKSKLQVDGGVQVGNDTDAASANKVGTLRYRETANDSYVEMCMKTGASAYSWVIIKQNSW
jgi:hypothetical protein